MLGLKVRKENAEKVKRYLAEHKLMVINYRVHGSGKFIYFPIESAEPFGRRFLSQNQIEIVKHDFEALAPRIDYRRKLQDELGDNYESVSRGYDAIGSIALMDHADDKAAARKAAALIMSVNKNIKTVLAKGGPVSGVYRKRKYEHIAGKKEYTTLYKENGAAFQFDVRRTFFSTRLAYERNRLCKASRDGECIMVMFAGVGPFAIEIARTHKSSKVIAMELNRSAFASLKHNIKINHAQNISAELGDVKELAKRHKGVADRVIMPLPKDSYDFLGSVLAVAARRCIVHYYAFGNRDDAFDHHIAMLRSYFRKRGRKFDVLYKRVVRNYSPSEIEIVVDFVIY